MKKHKKSKKGSKVEKAVGPDLVHVMIKLTERLEALDQKMTLVLDRVSALCANRGSAAQVQTAGPQEARKERTMHKAVCTDCYKECEIPFKPMPGRPVYCKECFALRKAGHVPQDPDMRSKGPSPEIKAKYTPAPMDYLPGQSKSFVVRTVVARRKKTKPFKKKAAKRR